MVFDNQNSSYLFQCQSSYEGLIPFSQFPIWCVIFKQGTNSLNHNVENSNLSMLGWDTSLHLPLWVSGTEKNEIEKCLEEWTNHLEASGADIGFLASCLKKPLRPLWISQKTVIWLNEVPDASSWDFTPIILLSASSSSGIVQHMTTSEFSWNYIPGAGDDEESWARGLTPPLFWSNVYDIINSGPDSCNQKVADIVEKDRVYRARRGQNAPQVALKPIKLSESTNRPLCLDENPSLDNNMTSDGEDCMVYWIGSTNTAVASTQVGMLIYKFFYI